ncbi:MAG: hypothetical protein R2834_10395 [Rhodothermales bacterium]
MYISPRIPRPIVATTPFTPRARSIGLATALLVVLTLTGCTDQTAVPDPATAEEALPIAAASDADVGLHASNLARRHLHEARANVDGGQYALAIAPLRESAELLNRRAAEASGEAKADLERSARVLIRLVEREQFGPSLKPQTVDHALAYAYFALAEFHVQQALEVWQRKETDEATAFQLNTAGVFLNDANEQFTDDAHPDLHGVVIDLEAIGRSLAEHRPDDRQHITARIESTRDDLNRLRPFFEETAPD